MSNPFEFVLAILFICVGIPVIGGVLVSIVHGPKEFRKKKWQDKSQEEKRRSEKESEMLEEIYYGLNDLGKRIKNLETILDAQGDKDE